MHAHGIETYWANAGDGSLPDPTSDHVVGDVVIQTDGNGYNVDGADYVVESVQ